MILAVLLCGTVLSGCLHVGRSEQDTDTAETSAAEETTEETTEEETTEEETTEEETTAEEIVTTESETFPEPEENSDSYTINNEGSVLVTNHRAVMIWGGSYNAVDAYCEAMNLYAQLMPGIRVYSMDIPTSYEYYLPASYPAGASQSAQAQYMRERFAGVTDVNVFEVLRAHRNEPIYLRTDHHWAPLGAYYAAGVFADCAGVPYALLSSYEKIDCEGYIGSMPVWFNTPDITAYPEVFTYYKPNASYQTTYYNRAMGGGYEGSLFFDYLGGNYCVFLGTDDQIAHIHTSVGNGRRLCVLKDSFGNAMIPFLVGSFEDIWVVDYRYFELNLLYFLQEQNVTDLLVATCAYVCCGGSAWSFRPLIGY